MPRYRQAVTLYVLAHGATHTIRQKSPAQFEKPAELTVMRYQMADASFEDMVEDRLQELEERHGQEQAWKNMIESERYDYAREEVVCDSMQTVLNDGVALQEMANREPTVFGKLKQFITELIGRIRRAMKGIPGYTKEAREFAGIAGDMEEIERAFAEASEEAGRNPSGNTVWNTNKASPAATVQDGFKMEGDALQSNNTTSSEKSQELFEEKTKKMFPIF